MKMFRFWPLMMVLTVGNSFAQEKFKLSMNGYNQPVHEFLMTQDSIYNLADKWIKKSFVDSDEVIQSKVEKEMIRFQTFIPNGTRLSLVTFNLKMRFRVDVKGGKYRLTIEDIKHQAVGEVAWVTMEDLSAYFNKKGGLRKIYRKMFEGIDGHLNRINQSLYDAVSGKKNVKADDW